jgi:hypothetical protein
MCFQSGLDARRSREIFQALVLVEVKDTQLASAGAKPGSVKIF